MPRAGRRRHDHDDEQRRRRTAPASRARLDGIEAAGKTGTTNAYRDAWFVGYTGNFVCGVWFGNDDYSSTNRMTGGALPAMTWHSIMDYAHQGIELKQLPGVAVPPARQPQAVAEAKTEDRATPPPPRPAVLTKRGAECWCGSSA